MNFFNLTAKVFRSEEVRDSSTVILEKEQSVDAIARLSSSPITKEQNHSSNAFELTIKRFIGSVLKYGVFLASAVVLVGGILYLIAYGAEPANYQFFRGEPNKLCSPIGIVTTALSGDPLGIIQLGLLILIATPVSRVTLSVLMFLLQRDWLYAIVTLFVLSELIYSFIGAY